MPAQTSLISFPAQSGMCAEANRIENSLLREERLFVRVPELSPRRGLLYLEVIMRAILSPSPTLLVVSTPYKDELVEAYACAYAQVMPQRLIDCYPYQSVSSLPVASTRNGLLPGVSVYIATVREALGLMIRKCSPDAFGLLMLYRVPSLSGSLVRDIAFYFRTEYLLGLGEEASAELLALFRQYLNLCPTPSGKMSSGNAYRKSYPVLAGSTARPRRRTPDTRV